MKFRRICLIGQIIVDVFDSKRRVEVRLGGAMHAARGLWALGCPFDLLYIAPAYLDDDVRGYARQLGAGHVENIGTVTGCPNVLFVGEPREVGNQRYEMVLENRFRCAPNFAPLRRLSRDVEDVIIFPGGFELADALRALAKSSARVYVDSNLEPADASTFAVLRRKVATIIMSTSSIPFLRRFAGSSQQLCDGLQTVADGILLKENRGGSRFFPGCDTSKAIQTPSHPRRIKHSIGVGDCFDAVFVCLRQRSADDTSLAYASLIAAEYACELDLQSFKRSCRSTLKIPPPEAAQLRGISLPWELRRRCNVYIAAPDFSNVDTSHIDAVVASLDYHNFSPRRPVRENGEIAPDADEATKVRAARADMSLLASCQIVVAVLLFHDPGTLIEIGVALDRQLPVIVYDPLQIASNLILSTLPTLVTSDLDDVITEVFAAAQRALGDGR